MSHLPNLYPEEVSATPGRDLTVNISNPLHLMFVMNTRRKFISIRFN